MKVTHVNSGTTVGHVITLTRAEVSELFSSLAASMSGNDCGRKEFHDNHGEFLTFLVDFTSENKARKEEKELFLSVMGLVPRTKLEELRHNIQFHSMIHPLYRTFMDFIDKKEEKPFRKLNVESEEIE